MGSGQSFPSERRNSRSSSGRYNKVRSSNSRSNSTVCIANKYNNNNNINSSITSNTVNHSSSILNNSHYNNNSISISNSNNNTKRSNNIGNNEEKSLVSSSINMSGAVSEKPMPSSELNPPQHHTQDASHDHLRRVNLLKANAINKHNTKRQKQPENEWHGNVLRKSYESRGQTNSAFQSLKTMNSMEKKEINVLRRIGEQNSTSSANKSNFSEGNNDNHNKNNSTSNINDQQGNSSKANSLVENVAHELTEEENRQHIFSSTSPSILVQRKAHEMRRGSRVSSKSNSHLFGEPENNVIPKEPEETTTTMKETKPQSEPLSSSSLHECNEVHTPKLPQNRLLKSSKPQCGSTSKTITLPPAITPKNKKSEEQKKNSSHTSNITNHSFSGVATTPSVSTSNELFPHDLKPPPLPILQTRSSFRTSTNTSMSNTNNNTTNTMSGNSERMRGNNASPLETRLSGCHLPIISLSTESVPYKQDKEENMKSGSGSGMYHLHNSGSMISNTSTSSRSNSNSVVNSNDNSLSSNILNGSTNAFKKQRETAVFNSNDFINVGLSLNGDDSVGNVNKDLKIVTTRVDKNNNNANSNNAVNVKKETITSHNKTNIAHPEQGSLSSLLMLQPQFNSLQSDGWSRSLNSHNESNESVLTDVAEDLQNNVMDAFIKCDTPQDSNYYSDGFEDYEEVVSNESVKSQGSNEKDNNNYQYLEEEEEEEESLDDDKDKKESKETKEVCKSNLDTHRKSGSPSHTKRSSTNKDKFTFGEIHNNIDEDEDEEEDGKEEENTSPTRNKEHKSQHGSNNKNKEKDSVDHAHAHRGRPNNPFQEKAQRHRNSSSRSQGLVTFYGSTQVCRVCGDSNVAYVSAKHNSPTHPANDSNDNKQTNISTSTITGERGKNNKADGKEKDSKINKKQIENHEEKEDEEEEEETYMCEKCYFADNGAHAMVPMQEIHCMNSRTCISSSATSLTTNTNTYNWGTSSEAAISSFFYSPCAVCERIIDDAEVVYRCEKCDYIVCENCYTTRFSEVQHDDPVKRFQRRQRSDSIHETNYLCKKRDNDGNKIINDYVVVRELGKGSFAKVKLVQHIVTHELFALKILKRQRSHAFNMAQFSSLHNNNNYYNNEQQQQPWPTSAPSPYLESGGNNNEKQKKEELQEENGKENDEEITQHHHISITTDVNPLRFRSRHNSLAAGISNDDLLREIAVMKFINHPNVVELKEVIDDADANKVYVIMEYCENGPIHVWGQPPLPIEKVRRYGCDILKGLLHLHSEFLYHRDVKPANCLVDSHNVAKLADFGACTSRIMSAATEGTLAYSSPEQVRGENVAGDVVDSWAFAMTLYESAFGELPFKIDSVSSWQKQLSSSEEIVIPLTVKYPVKSVNPITIDNTNGDVNSTKNTWREVPVDADFRDLLQRMFCKDLSKRMLLSEAAAHPFFTNVQDIDLAASLRSFGSLLRSIQVAGCNRPSVSELYDKALDAVHRGSHVQNSFHGVRAMKKIQRKSKKSKLNDFMDLLDEESLENQEDSLYELTLDTNKVEDNNIESKEKQTISNVNSKNIVNTQFTFPTREYDLALSPQEMALPCDEEEKQLPSHIERRSLETNAPMTNKETKTVSTTSTIDTNTNKVNVQENKMGEVNDTANVSSDTKCVKYVQVRMKELPVSLYESKATLERLVCQGNALSSVNTLNFNIFTQLKDVAITHNCLTQFPISLLRTPHLLRLDLSCNNIKVIPPELCQARFLERLNLHNNAIQEVGVTIKKPVMESQIQDKNNNENHNSDDNNITLNDTLVQNVKSVLAAPCLRHVRLTNNELVRLPLALYSTNASLELVLDANPKLMNEWNELLHDQTQSLPILTSYVDKSSNNNKTENTHHDDKSNAKRKNSLSAKSLTANSDLIEKKRNKSSDDKKKKKKKKKEKQEKTKERRKSSGEKLESEENKLAIVTKDKSKVDEKKSSQEVPQDE